MQNAWILDVDGTITNPEEKRVTNPEMFTEIIKRLEKGEAVALVTGRALDWLVKIVVDPLLSFTQDKKIFNNFYVSAEFGGSYMIFENGERKRQINHSNSVPQSVIKKTKEALKSYKTSHFWDADKETMVSLEMKNGMKVEDFKHYQKQLADRLRKTLDDEGASNQFEVHTDRIATNIKDKRATKAFSACEVRKWLLNKNLKPQKFFAFGDGTSDLDIADELYMLGENVEFVFVGNPQQIENFKKPYKIIFTNGHCDKGTLEYLRTH